MKLNILTTAAILAMTGAALTQAAKAQFVAANSSGTANDDDLILSFQLGGNSTNYEIDLGQASTYFNASSTINIANINTDLKNVYGSGYFTNAGLAFGILGVDAGSENVFVSYKTNPFPVENGNVQDNTSTNVDPIYSPGAAASNLPTDGTTIGSFLVPTANTQSFQSVQATDGLATGDTTTFNLAGTAPQLKLEELVYGNGGLALGTRTIASGYIDITSAGEVQYVLGSAPEPSTSALMMLGGGLLFWHLRRKSSFSI